jgi:hypothetical protein
MIKQLWPDQATYEREEQRRFEILLAHWDVPVTDTLLRTSCGCADGRNRIVRHLTGIELVRQKIHQPKTCCMGGFKLDIVAGAP